MNFEKLRMQAANNTPVLIKGSASASVATYERISRTQEAIASTKDNRKFILATPFGKQPVNLDWLPGAAETYSISADPNDFVICDVPLVSVDIPNRNCQAFPYEEVSYFDPQQGQLVYKTFIGKPTFINHDNRDPKKAKGVNFDASLVWIPKYKIWKIRVLSGFDRTKDKDLAEAILKGKRPFFSMAALVSDFVCSVCGKTDTQINPCKHIRDMKGNIVDNSIVYQLCIGATYAENSNVDTAADPTAESDNILS